MATSGTFSFTLTAAEIIDEAFERCGRDPVTLTFQYLNSARRSLNLLFSAWSTQGVNEWTVERQAQTLTQGDETYTLPTGGLDVLSMVLRRSDQDTPILPIGRDEYLNISDKDVQGRPTLFFVDRRITTPVIYLWNAPENSTDQIIYYYIRRLEDVGNYSNNVDTPYYWTEAVCAGLADHLSTKFAPEKKVLLKQEAKEAFNDARTESRERGPTTIRFSRQRS
jgi:hypothetical protein